MDAKIWVVITRAICSAIRKAPKPTRRPQYSDFVVLKMYFWAVFHDRPMKWACDRSNSTRFYRPRALPSESQLSRRLRTERFQQLLEGVHAYFVRNSQDCEVAYLDGKPLPVSICSRDPDARIGWCTKGFARGYRLHACVTNDQRIVGFSVTPMNDGEARVAREDVPIPPRVGLVMADANYDSGKTYTALHKRGHQLLTPLKTIARTEKGWNRIPFARQIAARLQVGLGPAYRAMLELRKLIERTFSAMSSFGGGLAPLPPWVRRLHRVRRWVAAKISIYHARLNARLAAEGVP